MIPRIFVAPDCIKWPNCRLDSATLHHLRDVVRLRSGDRIEVVSANRLLTVTLRELDAKSQLLNADVESESVLPDPRNPITLFQCLPKGDKMTDIIRSCTELGVSCFVPVISKRTVSVPDKSVSHSKVARWTATAYSAAAQSHQPRIPEIQPPVDWTTAIRNATPNVRKLIFWEE
ncbi:RsmE family RNA methyltransferase, partial [bacterium]|nr:RsmE family RNA methyltransferase [bacterium]